MKNLRIYTLLIIALLLASRGRAQQSGNFDCPAAMVKSMMDKYHCCPRPFDEKFSSDVLNDFVSQLDAEHLYFTASDIKTITGYKNDMNLELTGKNEVFMNEILGLYQSRLKKADSTIKAILHKPFNFFVNDAYCMATDSSDFPHDERDYQSRWEKYLKYNMMTRLTDLALTDSTYNRSAFIKENEATERDKELKTESRKINRILQHPGGYENYVSTLFCNVVASAYDPHSEFYPLTDKENYTGSLTGQEFLFGIEIGPTDKDEVEITHITPGSPAWKSGTLNEGDVITELRWEKGETVDLTGADAEEVSSMLSDYNHNEIVLTVRKRGGGHKIVHLMKEQIKNEDSFVKSFVLDGPRKIGYILLPGFYEEWTDNVGSSCANDVAKELVKLQKAHIEGLILDLRNNGGGSMEEAMQLAGIFIDQGVLGFGKERDGKSIPFKDPNRGTMYDGPMLVMVNGASASASEFVAGALQDYNRAIIAGSRTFGKATMQEILPVDTTLNLDTMTTEEENRKSDFVKLTVGKLYRANGRSNQLTGVRPDIMLPEIEEGLGYYESDMKHALSRDTVKKASYYSPLPAMPLKVLAGKSADRLGADSGFLFIKATIPTLRNYLNIPSHPIQLEWDSVMAERSGFRDIFNGITAIAGRDTGLLYKVENNPVDKQSIEMNPYSADINASTIKNIRGNLYIRESFRILTDYIQLLNKN